MALTVIGVFDDATDAQQAVDELVDKGFSRSNIDISAQTATAVDTDYTDDDKDDSGIGGFFRSLFGSDDDDARRHTRVANRGSVVTVHTQSNDEAEQAADILDDNGAVDVNERAVEYGYGTTGVGAVDTGTITERYDTTDTNLDLTTGADQTIKVIQEDLEVGKREVETGGVRVRSRIIERPVEESLRLREERVRVQRTPVDRPASDADLTAFQEGQIELTEHAEVPVVSKTARVVEEVSVGKDVTERVETVRDTVRSTDVEVEDLGTTDRTRYGDTDETVSNR